MEIIKKYFPELTEQQISRFEKLGDVYQTWNDQINVISRKDIGSLYERHVLHSLSIARFISFKPGSTILDVGTGGGFPGIPLAILFPETQFHLVDSIGKKIMVVSEVCLSIDLKNVTTAQIRVEQVKDEYDFVLGRAVIRLKPFLQWVKKKFKSESIHSLKNGVIALKGGELAQELSEIKRAYKVMKISNQFEEEFFKTKKLVYIPMVK